MKKELNRIAFDTRQNMPVVIHVNNDSNHSNQDVGYTKCIVFIHCISTLTSCGIAGYMLYLSTNKSDCETNISLYLLLASIHMIINAIYEFIGFLRKELYNENIRNIVGICGIAFWIYGSVMVFTIDYNSHVCPDEIYMFAFVWQIILYSLTAVLLICGCCTRMLLQKE